MKIIWSDFASNTIHEIFDYYKLEVNLAVARKIKSNIFRATEPLINFPNTGQIELTLETLNEGHRYLVVGNYKVIYKPINEGILITDVFDTRQDPIKINNENR